MSLDVNGFTKNIDGGYGILPKWYAAVFWFNLRQLARYLVGEVRLKIDKMNDVAANNADMNEKTALRMV